MKSFRLGDSGQGPASVQGPTQVVGAEMGHWLLKENVHKHRVRRVGEEPSKQGLSTHWFSKSTEFTRETGRGF